MLRSRTSVSSLLRHFSPQLIPAMNTASHLLSTNSLLEEEENPDYDPKRFYPARVGQTINKYQIVSKLGWGTDSTVWLAKETGRFVQHPLQPTGNNHL